VAVAPPAGTDESPPPGDEDPADLAILPVVSAGDDFDAAPLVALAAFQDDLNGYLSGTRAPGTD
jgi:hypothetical protein